MEAVIVTAMLVFARIGALVAIMPVWSTTGVPKHVPVLGAFAVMVIVSPTVPVAVEPASLGVLLWAIVGEIALGTVMGGGVRLVFGSIGWAAEIMALQVGFGAFSLLNPLLETREGPLGTLATWLAVVVFLGLGLHLRALEIVASSFGSVPPGQVGDVLLALPMLTQLLALSFTLALQLAAPTLALAWMVNVFIAILSKIAPRMNVFFSIGLTLGSAVGLFMVALALPWLLVVHSEAVASAVRAMLGLLNAVS